MKMFIDDNVIIPDEIKKMSAEELKKAIQELETRIERTKTGFIITTVHNIIPHEKTPFLHVEQRFFYM